MTGTPNQQEWAQQIKPNVDAEFARVEKAFQTVADRQTGTARMNTEAILDILQRKRSEVMAMDDAGYFIKEWQELRDQVRQLIADDPSYQAIKAKRVDSVV